MRFALLGITATRASFTEILNGGYCIVLNLPIKVPVLLVIEK